MLKIDLSGKNALVTGASQGIGRAIAGKLAQAGARVAGHHFSHAIDGVDHPGGSRVQPFQADLSSPQQAKQLFHSVVESFGHIDILVNNAGLAIDSPLDLDDERWLNDWQYILNVNLTACGILCREAVRHFQGRGGGRIINIASRAAFRGDIAAYLAYASSKGGVVALTRSLARAFGKDNIQSFVIAPGFTRTKMAQQFIDIHGEDLVLKDIALSRLTEPEDIAPTVAFLASGLADHATGCTIDINAASYVH
ncbi:MAG: SDR family NAD(P)-dependent oxidoreductase [Candidatus Aminicenantes bacterium]|nr:SDR family NAD(P)-dependent oxidoreductase [Candidatus Aminicenantes bacterium]